MSSTTPRCSPTWVWAKWPVDAALLILERMGLSPDDLTAAPRQRLVRPRPWS